MALTYPPQGYLTNSILEKLRTDLLTALPTRIVFVLEDEPLLQELMSWSQASRLCVFPAGKFPTVHPLVFHARMHNESLPSKALLFRFYSCKTRKRWTGTRSSSRGSGMP